MSDLGLDPPTTLLGLLQRGRGLGLQLALGRAKDEARSGLAECLRHDPRWDAQVETRKLYYADVATAVDMPIAEIHQILRELVSAGDEMRFRGQYQVAGVLGVLATRGDREALDALVAEVCEGQAWHAAADELGDRCHPEIWAPLGGVLFARLSEDEVMRLAEDRYKLDPWGTWESSNDRYRAAVQAAEQSLAGRTTEKAPPARKADTRLSTQALLGIVEQRNWVKIGRVLEDRQDPSDRDALIHSVRDGSGFQKAVALQGLRAMGDTSLLDEVVDVVRDADFVMARRQALRYLAALPPALTLERARGWLQEPWPVSLVGREILEHHATIDDQQLLRETLATAIAEPDMYSACFAVDALACFDATGAHAEIREFYETTPYAYGRWRAARALARFEDDFGGRTAIECLHDCEPRGRLLGIEHAKLTSPEARERVGVISGDPAEDERVGDAARTRMEGASEYRVDGDPPRIG